MAKTSPGEFVNQVRAEARKVVWPSRQETTTTAIFVGLMMVIGALGLGLQYYFSRRARYRERWRIDDEKLPPGWWNRR